MMLKNNRVESNQQGAVLITALVMLMVITLVSVAAMRSSRLELRMANNAEIKQIAFQNTQAVVDAVFESRSSVPVIGGVGFKTCSAGVANCDAYSIVLDNGFIDPEFANGNMTVTVERVGTEEMPVPRGFETSADKYAGAAYSIQARYDRNDEGLGRADLVEGMFVLVPK